MHLKSTFYCFLLATSVGFSQEAFVTEDRVVSSVTIKAEPTIKSDTKNYAPEGVNLYTIPFFGDYTKTAEQVEEDRKTLLDCQNNFSSREEASAFFSKMAWEYLAEGNKETAIHRFNIAWLAKKNNPEVYWGLGVILIQEGNFTAASEAMEKGLMVAPNNEISLMVDLATIYLQEYSKSKNPTHINRSKELLLKATELGPNFANGFQQLSLLYLVLDENKKAWEAFHNAFKLDPTSINLSLSKELLSRCPDPQGLFK